MKQNKNLLYFFASIILIILLVAFYFNYDNLFSSHNFQNKQNEQVKLKVLLGKLDNWDPADYKSKERKIHQALIIAKSLNDSNSIAKAYFELGNIFQKTERSDSSLIYFTRSKKIAESTKNDTLLGKTYKGIAFFHLRNEDYNEATQNLSLALKKSEKVNDDHNIGLIYNGFGIVYVSTKEFDKALDYFQKARDLCLQAGDKINALGINFNIANTYAENSDFSKALETYKLLLDNFSEAEDTAQIINTLSNMAIVSRGMGQYKNAKSYFEQALNYFDDYENQSLKSSLMVEIGVYHHLTKDYEAAEKNLLHGIDLASGTYSRTNRTVALQHLSQIEEERGNAKKALEYHKLFTITKDSIMNSEIQKRITDIQWKYDFQKKENDHNLLQKKYEAQKNQNTFLVLLTVLLLVIAILIVFTIRLSNKNLKNSMKVKELANTQLQERIEAEEKINSLEKIRMQTEINAKNAEMTTTSLQLIQKNEILTNILDKLDAFQQKDKLSQLSIKEIKKIVVDNLNMDKDWERFKEVFEKVHQNFFINLKNRYPSLTENELRLCAFIKSNLQTKEIANMLNINPSSVTISRYRIRKKMELSKEVQLEDILRNI